MIRHRTDCKRGLDGALFCCMNKFGGLMTGEDKLRFGIGFDIIKIIQLVQNLHILRMKVQSKIIVES